MKIQKPCIAESCAFWIPTVPSGILDKNPAGKCVCEDGSWQCPIGRMSIDGALLIGDEKQCVGS